MKTFRSDNTVGYSEKELAELNRIFDETIDQWSIQDDDIRESFRKNLAETILMGYDLARGKR